MPNNLLKSSVLTGVVLFSTGCDKLLAALEGGGPSYCEALCDWAVPCGAEESSLSLEKMEAQCDEYTHDADPTCLDAEKGNLNAVENLALNECTEELGSMTCDDLTGKDATPPAECFLIGGLPDVPDLSDVTKIGSDTPYGTFNAARYAVMGTGDELCDDITEMMCEKFISCSPDYESGAELKDEAMDRCRSSLSSFTGSCKSEGLYAQEGPTDFNPTRYMAKECVASLDASDSMCDGAWASKAECLLAFTSTDGVSLTDELVEALLEYSGF